MVHITCLGEILMDMFPAEVGRAMADVSAFQPKPGGAPANVAVAAKRLGASSAFIGKVGNDFFGHHLIDVMTAQGVETRGMRVDDNARTTLAFIAMPDENHPQFIFYRNPGADMMLRADELDTDLLRSTRAFHFGSISLIEEPSRSATLAAIKIVRDSGALISFDVNYRPSLWHSAEQAQEMIRATIPLANMLKVNEAELELLSGTRDLELGARTLLNQGIDLCVITLGTNGSYFQTAQGGAHVAPFVVKTVDATGCGDAFTAGLLSRLIAHDDWRAQLSIDQLHLHLRYANAVGAITAQKLGVIPSLPTATQVDEFLARHP